MAPEQIAHQKFAKFSQLNTQYLEMVRGTHGRRKAASTAMGSRTAAGLSRVGSPEQETAIDSGARAVHGTESAGPGTAFWAKAGLEKKAGSRERPAGKK